MQSISYDLWTSVTLTPLFWIISGICFFLPFIIYILIGAFVKGKDSSGRVRTKEAIYYGNWWYAVVVYTIIGIGLYLILIIFPVWLKLFE